jgi:hypothetical protein
VEVALQAAAVRRVLMDFMRGLLSGWWWWWWARHGRRGGW